MPVRSVGVFDRCLRLAFLPRFRQCGGEIDVRHVAGIGNLTGLPAMCDGFFVPGEEAQSAPFQREYQPAHRISWAEPKCGVVVREGLFRLAGTVTLWSRFLAEGVEKVVEIGIKM